MADPILDDISHRRYNPLRGSWLLVSPHRTKRPWQGQEDSPAQNSLAEYDDKCYLCPGNLRAQGDRNPDYSNVFAFTNDFSAVRETQDEYVPASDKGLESTLLRAEAATGRCYVLAFSRKHNVTLADMTSEEILPVIEMWTSIYSDHLAPDNPLAAQRATLALPPSSHGITAPEKQLRYMQIFENKGAAMGCSNPHPHCQIWSTSFLPEEPSIEFSQMTKYRAENDGRHLLGDYVKLELEKEVRVVWKNDSFVVVCPWWGVWPFEILLLPRRHVRALVDLTPAERLHFAEAIGEVTRRYDNLFQCSFPYSSGIHQAPLQGTASEMESSYLHMHFYPPLLRSATIRKFLVGYELMAEPQRDITPEQAAARLRSCGGPLYRQVSM